MGSYFVFPFYIDALPLMAEFLIAQGIAPRVSPIRTKAPTTDPVKPNAPPKPISDT